MIATFMPKPFADRTGSGLHLHLSLWHDDEPRLPGATDERGLGLSRRRTSFVGGHPRARARRCRAVIAPTVNSYKRTGAVATASGATWAPRRATYGGNDRTHYIRVPDDNRVELRGGDGSANPYLAHGRRRSPPASTASRRELDPGPIGSGARRVELPLTLLHAMDAARRRPGRERRARRRRAGRRGVLRRRCKREEFFAWHNTVGALGDRPLPHRLLITALDRTRRPDHVRNRRVCTCATPTSIHGSASCSPECSARCATAAPTRPGVAVYGDPTLVPGRAATVVSLLDVRESPRRRRRGAAVGARWASSVSVRACDANLSASPRRSTARSCRRSDARRCPQALVVGFGSDLAVLKGVGHPRELADRFGLRRRTGWQGVAHTRMATESAVTAGGLPPVRRRPRPVPGAQRVVRQPRHHPAELAREGVVFDSENDTEVGARFVAHQLAGGRRRGEGAD